MDRIHQWGGGWLHRHAVVLVGIAVFALSGSYGYATGGPLDTLLLELALPLVIGVGLCWFGLRPPVDYVEEWQPIVTICALGSGAAIALLSGWITYLVWLRNGIASGAFQPMVSAVTVGIGFGAVIGHIYVELSRHYLENQRLSQAVEASLDGIAIVEDGRYRYVNDAYGTLYGVTDTETLEDRSWDHLYTNASKANIEREVLPALAEHNFWRGTLTGKRTDGTTFPMEMSVSSLTDGFVVVARDVSTQRSREQRIQVLSRVLRHNLRNAFTVIRGHVNMIGEYDSRLKHEHVDPIREEIDDLLTTADKARGVERTLERHGETDVVDVEEVIRSAVDRATAIYPDARIRSHVETSGGESLTVATSVLDAVNELVDNAVEHHPSADGDLERATPTVELGAHTVSEGDERRLELTVADDGETIPEAERRAVLEGRETQLDHGSGLGLWLVNWIVTTAGGDLRFSERPTGGTTVTCSFPHTPSETEPTVTATAEVGVPE